MEQPQRARYAILDMRSALDYNLNIILTIYFICNDTASSGNAGLHGFSPSPLTHPDSKVHGV